MTEMLALPATVTLSQAAATLLAYEQALDRAQGAASGVDASALERFDSSLIAVLLGCARAARAKGQTFELHAAPPKLIELARLYGVAELLESPTRA